MWRGKTYLTPKFDWVFNVRNTNSLKAKKRYQFLSENTRDLIMCMLEHKKIVWHKRKIEHANFVF